jgi:hypothetical protein
MLLDYRCADKLSNGYSVKLLAPTGKGGKCDHCGKRMAWLQEYEITQKGGAP